MKIELGAFNTLVFMIFLTLKLTHVIEWSWWWVFAPFWIPLCLIIVVVCAALSAKRLVRLTSKR